MQVSNRATTNMKMNTDRRNHPLIGLDGRRRTAGLSGKWCLSILPAVLLGVTAGCQPAPSKEAAAVSAETIPTGDELRRLLDEVLEETYTRRLNLEDHAAWQILHGVVAYGREFRVEKDGEPVPAVDYLLAGGAMKGWTMEPGERGLRAVVEPGSKIGQGHYDQWLAILARCGLKPDDKLQVGDRTYTMADFVAQVQWDVPRNVLNEYSWTLVGLTTYLPVNTQWTAMDGKQWSMERLVEIELQQDLTTSACGGTHRLMGLAITLNRHLSQGGQLTGVWAEADKRLRDAMDLTRRMQNPDGTFSTRFFDGRPGTTVDLGQNLMATGHTLEFLANAMTDEQLHEPWIARAAVRLCDILDTTKDLPLECGSLYHAVHALVLYRERLFGPRSYAQPLEPQA